MVVTEFINQHVDIMADKVVKFWVSKSLAEMTPEEWEALCDGCGLCCLQKLVDEDDEAVYYTRIACKLLDLERCQCTCYAQRQQYVPDCVQLTLAQASEFDWLPETCAYRRLANHQALPDWHPLLTTDPETVHSHGVSLRGKLLSEEQVPEDQWEQYLVFRVNSHHG